MREHNDRQRSTQRVLFSVLILLLCSVSFAATARADLEEGLAAYAAHEYQKAWDLLEPEAEAGSAVARYHMYLLNSTPGFIDKDGAHQWLRLSAEQGYHEAQYHLGHFHEFFLPEEKRDYQKAAHWYGLAADQGNGEAMYRLGWLHEQGDLGKPDMEQAVHWYRQAAETGDPGLQVKLASALISPAFGAENREEAIQWLRKAAGRGPGYVMHNMNDKARHYLDMLGCCQGEPVRPEAILDWEMQDCLELPRKKLRIAFDNGYEGVSVYSGKGKVVLELGPTSSRSWKKATDGYFEPDISPDQERMVCLRCDQLPRLPAHLLHDASSRGNIRGFQILEADLKTKSRRVIYQSGPEDVINSPVYTHDGMDIAFFSGTDLVLFEIATGEETTRLADVLPAPINSVQRHCHLFRSPRPGTFYLYCKWGQDDYIGTVDLENGSVSWIMRDDAHTRMADDIFGDRERLGTYYLWRGIFPTWSPCRRYLFYQDDKGMVSWKQFIGCYDTQTGKRIKLKVLHRGFMAL